jgi:hypothetical protein
MVTRDLRPAHELPVAISKATFSFIAHLAWIRVSADLSSSMTGVVGVPGYPVTRDTPASTQPRAIASFPEKRTSVPGLSRVRDEFIEEGYLSREEISLNWGVPAFSRI